MLAGYASGLFLIGAALGNAGDLVAGAKSRTLEAQLLTLPPGVVRTHSP